MSRVIFYVGGQTFSISRDLLNSGPCTRLSNLASKEYNSIEIDRPRDSFGAILNLYTTGELHIPPTVCPGEFKKEMQYWRIDVQYLSDCCYFRYQSFLEEQATLRSFRDRAFKGENSKPVSRVLGRMRSRIWSVIDYTEKSIISKIYFILCLMMVLLSILTLALSTDRAFQRSMTNCERLEYMESANMADITLFRNLLGQDCEGEELPYQHDDFSPDGSSGVTIPKDVLSPYPDIDAAHDSFDYDYEYISVYEQSTGEFKVRGSLGKSTNNSSPIPPGLNPPSRKLIKVPNMKVPIYTMFILEIVTVVFFTIDITLRLSTCPSLVSYFKSLVNIFDAAALLCTYFHYLATFLRKQDLYKDGWMDLLEYVQILRALRLLRVVKNVKASRVLVYSFRQNLRDLSIICIYIIVCMCVFASLFYITEGKANVKSMTRAWYYTIITLTTVGYGDVIPLSAAGKALSCICAITGLLLFAFTIPILANNFLTLYKYAYMEQRVEQEVDRKDEKQNGNKVVDRDL